MTESPPDFAPILLTEVDLARGVPDAALAQPESGQRYARAQSLVRAHTQPLGYVSLATELSADAYASLIWETLRQPILDYLRRNGLPAITSLTARGLLDLPAPAYLSRRAALLRNPPLITVVVTTRERPDSLEETLRSLDALAYPCREIVVVDNAPRTSATGERVRDLAGEIAALRYVREPRKGLCWARNAGLEAARGEIVVYTDDDVLLDASWLTAILEGFQQGENVGCVTGLILPRELETPAQVWCEEHGGFGKGFASRIYDLDGHRADDALYPYRVSMLGSGANMAFRTAVLREAGGFDPALGAGTVTRSASEFPPLFQVIRRGYQLVYQPAAIVYHSHHREYAQFREQFYGYGVGFTAFLTKCILEDPLTLVDLLRRLPYALHFTFSAKSPRHKAKSGSYPKELNHLELRGMLYGPLAYLRSRRRMRQFNQRVSG